MMISKTKLKKEITGKEKIKLIYHFVKDVLENMLF